MNKTDTHRILNELTGHNLERLKITATKLVDELDFSNKGYVTLNDNGYDEQELGKHLELLQRIGIVRKYEKLTENSTASTSFKVGLRELEITKLRDLLEKIKATRLGPASKNNLGTDDVNESDQPHKAKLSLRHKVAIINLDGVNYELHKFRSSIGFNYIGYRNLLKFPRYSINHKRATYSKNAF